jgi:hypothetical protein
MIDTTAMAQRYYRGAEEHCGNYQLTAQGETKFLRIQITEKSTIYSAGMVNKANGRCCSAHFQALSSIDKRVFRAVEG